MSRKSDLPYQDVEIEVRKIKVSRTTLQLVDQIHDDEIELLRQFIDILGQGDEEQISLWLEKLIEHADAHFREEDAQMFRVKYPGFDAHWHAHGQALKRMLDAQRHWEEDKDLMALWRFIDKHYLLWFDNHTLKFDLPAVEYIKQYDEQSEET
jgi:hemerythrin-like metal-binding protein